MLNSYIFVFRKQNATRNCNVLFEFLYFGFLDPPIAHLTFSRDFEHPKPCSLCDLHGVSRVEMFAMCWRSTNGCSSHLITLC